MLREDCFVELAEPTQIVQDIHDETAALDASLIPPSRIQLMWPIFVLSPHKDTHKQFDGSL